MSTNLLIKPDILPELSSYPEGFNRSILENSNCIDFLTKNGITNGTLLYWSAEIREKKSSIFIPPEILNGCPVIIKFLMDIRGDVSSLRDQSLEQVQSLDKFIYNLTNLPNPVKFHFLFVVSYYEKNQKKDEMSEKMEKFIKDFYGSLEVLTCVRLDPLYVMKKDNDNSLPKKEREKLKDRFAIDSNTKNTKEVDAFRNAILSALKSSVPDYQILQLSEIRYNVSESEAQAGFTLENVYQVISLFRKIFDCCEKEITVFPDFDSTPGSILHNTSRNGKLMIAASNDFTGEQVDFTEKLLLKLTNPRGLLVRDYKQTQLNKILKTPYTLNFQFDWIFCSYDKIYAIEVSRSENPENPKSAIVRKINTTFTKSFPKFAFIMSTLLLGGGNNFSFTDRKNFVEKSCEFIIYFTNISFTNVEQAINSCHNCMKGAWNILHKAPPEVVGRLTVLCPEDATFHVNAPIACKIVKNDSSWKLIKSKCTIQSIFQANETTPVENSNVSKKASVADQNLAETVSQMCQYISGLLCFGFLACNFSIVTFIDKPLKWHDKIKKEEGTKENVSKKWPADELYPGVVLTPQQLGILERDHRFVYILGEPGTGKTLILFAKMLDAVKSPDVDHILFFFPASKTEFKKALCIFIEKYVDINFQTKIILATTDELGSSVQDLNLSRTIILGDELYFDPKEHWSGKDSSFFKLTDFFSWLPQLKQCWLTNTEAGQDTKKKPYRSTLPQFYTETLNVLFRCSWHIGSFCTMILHKSKAVSKSTSWVFGCTKSSQHRIFCNFYTDIKSLNYNINNCNDLRPKFDHDRMTVIFTSTRTDVDFETELEESSSKTGDIYVVNESQTFLQLPFTGIEKSSVLLIIDFCGKTKKEELHQIFQLYNMAISRAQFELCIFVNHSHVETVKPFLPDSCIYDDIVKAARQGWPLELSKIASNDQNSLVGSARANELLSVALQHENCELLKIVVSKMKPSQIDLRQVLGALDVKKDKEFLAVVHDTLGPVIKSAFEKAYYLSIFPIGRQFVATLVGS